MGFDAERFRTAGLEPRRSSVAVPELAHWFPDGEEPVWIVRALTGEELARANEAGQRAAMIQSAVEALAAAANRDDQGEAIANLIGYGSETPAELAKRFDHLVSGSVEPRIDRDLAVRLFRSYPVTGYKLTNEIFRLTGLGPEVGKSQPSTPTPASSTA